MLIKRLSFCLVLLLCLCGTLSTLNAQDSNTKFPKISMVSYMGWLPTSYNSSGIGHPTDFPVMSLLEKDGSIPNQDRRNLVAYGNELKLLADHGWDCMLADFLFFEESHFNRQIGITRGMLNAADDFNLRESFKIAPFFETKGGKSGKDPAFLASGLIQYLKEVGNHPRHLKIDGRPVLMFYGGDARKAEDWKTVIDLVHAQGYKPFWIYEHGGLLPALYGRFKPEETAGFGGLFDGAYNFGASGLEAATGMVTSLRKAYANDKTGRYVGGTIWPGYLSDRANNRNFISPRHTEFLRTVWEKTLTQKPDFLQWSTWNDYHESTSLSCTYSQLTSRMEISQRYLARYFDRAIPASDDGLPQSVLSYRKTLSSYEPVRVEFLPLPTSNVTGKARLMVSLHDGAGKIIATQHSDWLDLAAMSPWLWTYENGINRGDSCVIRVRASLELADGKRLDFANLPDIAVVRGVSYTDQLYYNVPLHRMADSSRSLRMLVNGIDGADGKAAMHEGVRVIDYKLTGDAGKAEVTSMCNGHLLRFLAPLDVTGAEAVSPGQGDRPIVLRKRDANVSGAYCDWRKPMSRDGEDYYAALVQFADGKWAYSPTVWSTPSTDYDDTSVLWSFVPQGKNQTSFEDWSGHEAPAVLMGQGKLAFDAQANNLSWLKLDGKQVLSAPLSYAPNGPMSVDVIIKPKSADRTNVICYQRGAQMSLIIRPDGLLEARRLPANRSHPDPLVKINSQSRLLAGQAYHVVVTYDGAKLSMYLNGQLQSQRPCDGTRSTERCTIGGNIVDGVSKEIDDIEVSGGFEGNMLRMHVITGAWTPQQVQQRFERAQLLGLWK
jgi:hypothetical protein